MSQIYNPKKCCRLGTCQQWFLRIASESEDLDERLYAMVPIGTLHMNIGWLETNQTTRQTTTLPTWFLNSCAISRGTYVGGDIDVVPGASFMVHTL
jgi:hypothetical protein